MEFKSREHFKQLLEEGVVRVNEHGIVEVSSELSQQPNTSSDSLVQESLEENPMLKFSMQLEGVANAQQLAGIFGGRRLDTSSAAHALQRTLRGSLLEQGIDISDGDDATTEVQASTRAARSVAPTRQPGVEEESSDDTPESNDRRKLRRAYLIPLIGTLAAAALVAGPVVQAYHDGEMGAKACTAKGPSITSVLGAPACFMNDYKNSLTNRKNLLNLLPKDQ